MSRQTNRDAGLLLAWVAGIYVICVAAAVIYSWFSGFHLFDLSLTVSLYVGLYQWSSVLYFIGATMICFLLLLHIRKTEMRGVQKLLYRWILLCVICCAWFPCNSSRSDLVTDIHNYFSYALAVLVALSFVLTAVFAGNKKQRVFAVCSIIYSAFFIAAYVCRFQPFKNTVFIWENVLIVLLFLELILERRGVSMPPASSQSSKEHSL